MVYEDPMQVVMKNFLQLHLELSATPYSTYLQILADIFVRYERNFHRAGPINGKQARTAEQSWKQFIFVHDGNDFF